MKLKTGKALSLILLASLICAAIFNFSALLKHTDAEKIASVSFTSGTSKQTYSLREPVLIQGTYTNDGTPVTDALIGLEIIDPRSQHFAFRTIPIGNLDDFWLISITDAYITDNAKNPISAAKVDSTIRLTISIRNNGINTINPYIAFTIFDTNLIPVRSSLRQITLSAQGNASFTGQVYIPEWTTPGEAIVSINAYSDQISDGGFPYMPEELFHFPIIRNEFLQPSVSQTPILHETQPGGYKIYFRMPPDRFTQPGTYLAYLTGRDQTVIRVQTSTSFAMQAESSPPQAAFTYYPPTLYANMSATFDASSSSAEGFNDTIIRYEWFFNDPYDPQQIVNEGNFTHPPTPLAYHTFENGGTFSVSLNVTDNEGLWSYTVKPIIIYPEYGPTANFTWLPFQPRVNYTITFDASNTEPGWSKVLSDFSPITQYTWNFDDGTGNVTITNPILDHIYLQPANYTVSLTVMDSVGRIDTIMKDIEVENITGSPYDVTGDGYVGIDDIVAVAEHFGTSPGHPSWDPKYDLTGDGYVGVDDIVLVAEHFGESS